jgi:hypothetical protein
MKNNVPIMHDRHGRRPSKGNGLPLTEGHPIGYHTGQQHIYNMNTTDIHTHIYI